MSTFDGRVAEFSDIRIDYFRRTQHNERDRAPLAYFLSHVHSDHLIGLDTCRGGPFIYCSPATRDILLRLEKYPHRMNFAKGILESRRQTYVHLRKRLKAIPLETPTTIELAPGNSVRVTLFDANHCVGAVGFLIEGDGKAILYTGDVRAEAWWVEALVRSPLMVSFTGKEGRRLDCLYLDTTFATSGEEGRYAEFPSKADGLRELVRKVKQYPSDTVFYCDAWTFGYEDVWQTLSTVLDAQVHVDDYRYGLYRALKNGAEPKAPEANKLMGYWCGNHYQESCLNDQWSRLHSCEYGAGCKVWEKDFVRITPIISRQNGLEMRELGAGGGKGDLDPKHELEFGNAEMMLEMFEAYESKLQGQPSMLSKLWKTVAAFMERGAAAIDLDVSALGLNTDSSASQTEDINAFDDMPLDKLLPALAQWLQRGRNSTVDPATSTASTKQDSSDRHPGTAPLPRQITFPYSRHSSYGELRHLVAALQPRDIYPCTVVDSAHWDPAQHSMRALFGDLYDSFSLPPPPFAHDEVMLANMREKADLQPWRPYRKHRRESSASVEERASPDRDADAVVREVDPPTEAAAPPVAAPSPRLFGPGEASLARRREAHAAALSPGSTGWWADVELVSVAGHQAREEEL